MRYNHLLDTVGTGPAILADIMARILADTPPPSPTAVSIEGIPPKTGTVGVPYAFAPVVSNGAGAKVFTLANGVLLGGLAFDTSTGAITGTPNVAGTMAGLVVRVTDATGSANTQATNVTIAGASVESPTQFPTVAMVRNDSFKPTVYPQNSNFGPVNVNMEEFDLYGTFPSGDAAGDFLINALDADNGTMVSLGGVGGRNLILFRRVNGVSTQIGTATIRPIEVGEIVRIRFTNHPTNVDAGIVEVFFGSTRIYRRETVRFKGGTKFSWRTYANPAATNVTTSPVNDPILAGLAATVSVTDMRARVSMNYTTLATDPDPTGFEAQVENIDGTVIIPWEDAQGVASSGKGQLDLVTKTAYSGQRRKLTNLRIRHKAVPAVTTAVSLYYPMGKASLGMNLTKANESAGERIFKDLCLYNDGWRTGGQYMNTPEFIDSNGNLIKKFAGADATYAFGRCTTPGARCELTWEGGDNPLDGFLAEGVSVTYGNPVRVAERAIQFDYNHSWDAVGAFGRFGLKSVNPANPVRNVRVKEVAVSWEGGVFDDDYIRRAAANDYNRLMDVMGSNVSNGIPIDKDWQYEFSDRPTPSNPRKNGLGWPLEWVIEFANRTAKPVWIMVPAGASPDFSLKTVRGMFYGELMTGGVKLDPTAMALHELGNEWFNGGFGIYHQAYAAAFKFGRANPETTTQNYAMMAEHAYRNKAHWAAINGQYPAGRLKKVLGVGPTALDEANELYHKHGATDFDVFTTAYYFFNIQFVEHPDLWPGENANLLLDFAEATIDRGIADVRQNALWAYTRGKEYWIYEGQMHWFEPTRTQPFYNEPLNKVVQEHPRVEGIMRKWIDTWTKNFDGGLTGYLAVGGPNLQFGSWGFLANQGPTALARSPKQRAWNAALADNASRDRG